MTSEAIGTYLARRIYRVLAYGEHHAEYFAELSDAERRALEGTLHNERAITRAQVVPLDVLTIAEVQAALREDFQLGE